MKKYLGIMVVALLILMPRVNAKVTALDVKCGDADASGNITCTVGVKLDESTTSLKATLIEQGGATVDETSIAVVDSIDWILDTANPPKKENGTWTINLTSSIGVTGETSLFKFTYKASGTQDCKVSVGVDGVTKPTTPPSNPKTGSSLPYIALASISVLAGGAYIATKNKSKMFRL